MLVQITKDVWINADAVASVRKLHKTGNVGITMKSGQFLEVFEETIESVSSKIKGGMDYGFDDTE